jgi:ATP-dependent Clp protease ATP-binding subunit ClpA
VFERFTPEARQAIRRGQRRAGYAGAEVVGVADLAHGSLTDGLWANRLLLVAGVDPAELEARFDTKNPGLFIEPELPTEFSKQAKRVIGRADRFASSVGQDVVSSAHLFVACLSAQDPAVDAIAGSAGLTIETLVDLIAAGCSPQSGRHFPVRGMEPATDNHPRHLVVADRRPKQRRGWLRRLIPT